MTTAPMVATALSTPPMGLLLVLMEPPATLEEEFNDWYDTEHFPQRMSLPGFVSGSRWACLQGWPRWAACYALEDVQALASPAYRAVSGEQSTPWSRRVLPRTVGRRRVIATLADAGVCPTPAPTEASFLSIAQYVGGPAATPEVLAALSADYTMLGATSLFLGIAQDDSSLWALAGYDAPLTSDRLHARLAHGAAGAARLLNYYTRYQRG